MPKVYKCQVEITRDALEKIVKDVFPHEIPILMMMFGDENVRLVADRAPGPHGKGELPPKNLNPREEYQRLERVYTPSDGSDVPRVTEAYGTFIAGRFSHALATPASAYFDMLEDEEDEEDGGGEPVAKVETIADIKAWLDEFDVEYQASLKKDELMDLLVGSVRGMLDSAEIEYEDDESVEALIGRYQSWAEGEEESEAA